MLFDPSKSKIVLVSCNEVDPFYFIDGGQNDGCEAGASALRKYFDGALLEAVVQALENSL